ncbi:MAG TPA: hypothetical protein O0X73_02000 [Methanocorpusculum sp.]|nr:hypothetical protein [Methanocorpusculum sp.]
MTLQSLRDAVNWMTMSPYVWMSGLWTATIILLSWYLYTNTGMITAISAALGLAFGIPAMIAGTYGIVLENESSYEIFRKYAVHCYFQQLLPSLLMFLIPWIISEFIFSLLMIANFDLIVSTQIAMFVFVPVVFFCYFSDVTAVMNDKRVFESIKDSFLIVINGSSSMATFYMMNITLMMIGSFCGSFIFSMFATDACLPIASMTDADILSMTPVELLAIISAPEIIFSGFMALTICAVIFVPLITLYKACFFAKIRSHERLEIDNGTDAESNGEYDEKGRWYKYK